MYKIISVKIEGFWGKHVIESKLHNNVNIFIGPNGVGKTTFINILQAVLEIDFERLFSLQFSKITINLKNKKNTKKIFIEKILINSEYREIKFHIGRKNFVLPTILSNVDYRRTGRIGPSLRMKVEELKLTMASLINLSYLSVHRGTIDTELDRDRPISKSNLIDMKLLRLNQLFARYRWQLESQINELSLEFQKQVLQLNLYDEEYDIVSFKKEEIDTNDMTNGLKQAFKDFKMYNNNIKKKIDEHVKNVDRAYKAVNLYLTQGSGLDLNDITPLVVAKRTKKIVQLAYEMEKKRNEIYQPVIQYIELLSQFMSSVQVEISKDEKGGLSFKKEDEEFPLDQLSSGEKQLIILFTEALLQKKSACIFIADEPEISLHISWQKLIIPTIEAINPNAQLIIATHSPEVVGKYRSSLIHLKEIIS